MDVRSDIGRRCLSLKMALWVQERFLGVSISICKIYFSQLFAFSRQSVEMVFIFFFFFWSCKKLV